MVTLAFSKGRILKETLYIFKKAGYNFISLLDDERKLKFEFKDLGFIVMLLKPFDVPVYVERGSADFGVVGKDVLMERKSDVLMLLDMNIGKCRISVAKPKSKAYQERNRIKVGTKFTNIAKTFFGNKGINADIIKLEGSVELAPLMGISDVIVDIVSSGETLRKNGLEEVEKICDISSYLIANRNFFKTNFEQAIKIINTLREVVNGN
jgi:ATP phosphoribosyltransferase